MVVRKPLNPVDPEMLARCFGVYARVATGATKYIRDEGDTLSLMMDLLRQDAVRHETVIDAFLAVQRLLSLHMKEDDLLDYIHRVRWMAVTIERFIQHKVEPPVFTLDPRRDAQAACWFRAIASENFQGRLVKPDEMAEMYVKLDVFAEHLWDEGAAKPFGDIDFTPAAEYEVVDEKVMASMVNSPDKRVLH